MESKESKKRTTKSWKHKLPPSKPWEQTYTEDCNAQSAFH